MSYFKTILKNTWKICKLLMFIICGTFITSIFSFYIADRFNLLPDSFYPQMDGTGPRMYKGTCNSRPPGGWDHMWMTPLEASTEGLSKQSLSEDIAKKLSVEDSFFSGFYVTLDQNKKLNNMPTLDHPSKPNGWLIVRTLAQGKKPTMGDKDTYVELISPFVRMAHEIRSFDLDPNRYDYYSCGFHATKQIDWCATDYPYGMNVPLVVDQCEKTSVPLDEIVDLDKNKSEISLLKSQGWITEQEDRENRLKNK